MDDRLLTQAKQYRKTHIRRKLWHRIVSVLACVVVFCTTYALILPAITLEETTFCGQEEHSHTEECYELQLVCGFEEPPDDGTQGTVNAAHVHTEVCFEEQQICICPVEESTGHIHDEACLLREEILTCTEDHEHTPECYAVTETMACGLSEGEGGHTHQESCFETRSVCVCGEEETPTPAEEPHIHTDECYTSVLTCEQEEHEHSLACYSDPEADRETAEIWDRSMAGVELTGVWADDLIAIAESQLGYCESTRNYIVMEDQSIKGVTRYGRWYGDAYGDWCAMFVSFCLNYAEIPRTAIPYEAACQRWVDDLSKPEWDFYRPAEEYRPVKGDLIFFDWDDDDEAEHIGIVREVGEETLVTIEGNSANCVRCNEYKLDDERIQGYGILPENPDPPTEEDTQPTEDTQPSGESVPVMIFTDDTRQTPADCAEGIHIAGNLPEDAEIWAYPVTVDTELQTLFAFQLVICQADGTGWVPGEGEAPTVSLRSAEIAEMEQGWIPVIYRISASAEPERLDSTTTEGEVRFCGGEGVYLLAATPEEDGETRRISEEFLYENELFTVTLRIEGSVTLPDGDPEAVGDLSAEILTEPDASGTPDSGAETSQTTALSGENIDVCITQMDTGQESYRQFVADLSDEFAEGLLDLSVLSLEFSYGGIPLDVSGCSITARIEPWTAMMENAENACTDQMAEAVPEAEAGVVFAVMSTGENGAEELDSTVVDTFDGTPPVLTASVDGNGLLAVASATTANPQFTVQYYAWLDVVADSGDSSKSLDVIDTSGKVLPKNGTTPALKKLYLEQTAENSGKYQIKTVSTLTQINQTRDYQYITAPNPTYFNRLYENGHYTMKAIWMLKDGKSADSTDPADWYVYDPATTHFTNRSQSVKADTVLIREGAVIRLVFDTTESTYTNAASFYDYDITNDGTHTAAQGINSPSNYSGSGTKLAFGNTNTDTGLQAELWNGNALNRYNGTNAQNYTNGNGYKGCTFGLASHLGGDKIQYSSGVIAPNLFNDGSATGKTSYDSGQYSLSFQRVGDTYTLSAVNGAGTSGLQYFNNPGYGTTLHTHIWTNNFWPMDSVSNKDGHTGAVGNLGTYTGATKTGNFPVSDDGVAHNNMFGMHYTVKFTLTEDYVGPLEYYFFGDDDMWVFLDGTLVCDIGGVHSSVGEYVDLWDYVEKGSAGEHILSFFYTERGLSGSTCYMQFTLPSVSSITPEQNTGLLRVEKKVEGAMDSDEEFHFDIKFTDANGNPLPDDYSYTRYSAEGKMIKQDVIIYDGGSFELKAGEYIIVNYLPYGTRYTITETNAPYYSVSHQTDGGTPVESRTAEGSILSGHNPTVVYTNTAMPVLPQTGGRGTIPYTIGGSLLILSALLLLYSHTKRRKEDVASS